MRWKTPKKQKNGKQKQKKQTKKRRKTKKTHTHTQIPKKNFSVISQMFYFLGGVQKLPFLTIWPRKRTPPKHYKNWGFQPISFFWKSYVSRNGHFWTKKPRSRNSSYHLFCLLSLSTTKNTKVSWNPYLYSVLTNLKKEFSNFKLKTQKIEKPNFCTLFSKKAIFRWLPDNWAQKKTQNDNCVCQKSLETTILTG